MYVYGIVETFTHYLQLLLHLIYTWLVSLSLTDEWLSDWTVSFEVVQLIQSMIGLK